MIIKEFPLLNKIDSIKDCFLIDKQRYVLFYDEMISRENIPQILSIVQKQKDAYLQNSWATIIIIGKTQESFKSEELFFFDNVNTFAVFYLIDKEKQTVYKNDNWIFALGLNYGKFIRKINTIITGTKKDTKISK